MAFDNLSLRFEKITRALRGKARITEKELDDTLREIRLVLLEADVSYKVVKDFIQNVRVKALRTRCIKIINTRSASY